MQVYSGTDVANHLKIKPTTLRKYCALLEEAGYTFSRNDQGHRYYSDKDVMALRSVLKAKRSGITLKEAVHGVVHQSEEITTIDDTQNEKERYGSDTMNELKTLIQQQGDMMAKQTEVIQSLSHQIEQQQEQINQLSQRLEAPDDHEQSEEKSIWQRLFKK
ncbi:DNA-binding transcriptional MerR regulator [Alkalibacillus flavidus]|uniref:DNA-binding transcriptional MerR regulator n=1 Tax=Alkalibacillus flavidus TaxID=546021 RepID=A0ABV2KY24_9BACI